MRKQNLYEPPQAALGEPTMPRRNTSPEGWLLPTAYWALFAGSLGLPMLALLVMPSFIALFAGFGADLPMLTRLVFDYRLVLTVIPLLAFIPALLVSVPGHLTMQNRRCYVILLVMLFAVLSACAGVVVFGLYLPIFAIGAVL